MKVNKAYQTTAYADLGYLFPVSFKLPRTKWNDEERLRHHILDRLAVSPNTLTAVEHLLIKEEVRDRFRFLWKQIVFVTQSGRLGPGSVEYGDTVVVFGGGVTLSFSELTVSTMSLCQPRGNLSETGKLLYARFQ